jgi:hypothetical protein
MFGLSDSPDKTTLNTPAVNDVTGGMSIDTAPPAPVDTSPANSQISSLPPGVSSSPDAAATVPASTPAPIGAPAVDPPAKNITPPTNLLSNGGISDVNLEKAYIPTDPPQASASSSSMPASPPTSAPKRFWT